VKFHFPENTSYGRFDRLRNDPFRRRYHLACAPKYRFKVLRGEVWLQVREIIWQVGPR